MQIVKEHHGVPSGVGFADRQVGTLSEMSMLFDVVHDFVELFINFPPDGSIEGIFSEMVGRYQINVYKNYAGLLKDGIVEAFNQ